MFCKCIVLALALASSYGFPGGYIAKGGVFKPEVTPDYIADAAKAGKMAWNHKFEEEAGIGFNEERGARQAAQTPVYFTGAQAAQYQETYDQYQQPDVRTYAEPYYSRNKRYQQPIYYYDQY